MKTNKMLCKIIFLVMFILMCGTTVCSANGLPSLSLFQPEPQLGSSSKTIIETLLGVLRLIGIITIIIGIALIGFNMILGSASEKAEGQGKGIGLVIAAALVTGGTLIAEMIISVAESM